LAIKKILSILLIYGLPASIFCQNLSGIWEGEFSTDMLPDKRRTFFMHMEIQQTGRDVRAVFFNAPSHDITQPGVMYLVSGCFGKKGKKGFPLTLTREGIIQNNIAATAEVFIGLNANHFQNDSMQVLYGTWMPTRASPRSDGAGGTFWLRRACDTISQYAVNQIQKKIKKTIRNKLLIKATAQITVSGVPVKSYSQRQDIITDTILLPSANVQLELYDNAEKDGDSVSLYMDDKPVLIQRVLSTKPLIVNQRLTKDKAHKIVLFADNVGAIPPNTALMVVAAGNVRKYIFLSADYNTNAAVVLKLMD
jgi:hypothetical protein